MAAHSCYRHPIRCWSPAHAANAGCLAYQRWVHLDPPACGHSEVNPTVACVKSSDYGCQRTPAACTPSDVGHQPLQPIQEFWRIRVGCISIHLNLNTDQSKVYVIHHRASFCISAMIKLVTGSCKAYWKSSTSGVGASGSTSNCMPKHLASCMLPLVAFL